jgi:hypothetical protein
LDGKFSLSTAQSVCSANFVEAASLHQVDIAQFTSGGLLRTSLGGGGIAGLGRYSTEFREIIFASVPAKLLQLSGERPLPAKPSEWGVAWELGIPSGFEFDLTHDWKSTKFPYESSKIVQQVLTRPGGVELVWLKPRLYQSVAPSRPEPPIPVRLLDARFSEKA